MKAGHIETFRISIGLSILGMIFSVGCNRGSSQKETNHSTEQSSKIPSTPKEIRELVQNSLFSSLPTQQGNDSLGSESINHIAFDKNRLYVATSEGLSISDNMGKTFETRTVSDGMGSSQVNWVFPDPVTQRIYLATNNGLSVSENGGRSFTNWLTDKGLPNFVYRVIVDLKGNIYAFCSKAGPILMVSTDKGLTFQEKVLPAKIIWSYVSPQGVIYIYDVDLKLYSSLDRGNTFQETASFIDRLGASRPVRLYVDKNENLYIYGGTLPSNGEVTSVIYVSKDQGRTFNKITLPSGFTNNGHWLSVSGNNIIAYGDQGLAESVDGGRSFTVVNKGTIFGKEIQSDDLRSFLLVREDGLKVLGTINFGLAIFEKNSTNPAVFHSKKPFRDIDWSRSVFKVNSKGMIFLAGFMKNKNNNFALWISKDNGATFQIAQAITNQINDAVKDSNPFFSARMEINNLDQIYLFLTQGYLNLSQDVFLFSGPQKINMLFTSTNDGNTFTEIDSASASQNLSCLSVDNKLGISFINNSQGPSFVFSKNNGKTYQTSPYSFFDVIDSFYSLDCHKIQVDGSGTIYIATNLGLFSSTNEGQSFERRTEFHGLGSRNVKDVFIDLKGNVYAATAGGLSISTDRGVSFVNYNSTIVGSNNVNQVKVDSSGRIYLGTLGDVDFSDSKSATGFSVSLDGGKTFINKALGGIQQLEVGAQGVQYLLLTNGTFMKSKDSLSVPGEFPPLNPPFKQPGADLIISQIVISPEVPKIGERVTYTATIKNIGSESIPKGTNISLTSYKDIHWSTGVNTIKLAAPLNPNSTLTLSSNTLFNAFDGGTKRLLWMIDPEYVVREKNKENNGFGRMYGASFPTPENLDVTYTESGTIDRKTGQVHINIPAQYQGKSGAIYIAIALPNRTYSYLWAQERWENDNWTKENKLPRAAFGGTFPSGIDFQLATNLDLRGLENSPLYIGIGLDDDRGSPYFEMLAKNRFKLFHTIAP